MSYPFAINLNDRYAAVVVYLFLVCYGRSKTEQIHLVIPSFLQVRNRSLYFVLVLKLGLGL